MSKNLATHFYKTQELENLRSKYIVALTCFEIECNHMNIVSGTQTGDTLARIRGMIKCSLESDLDIVVYFLSKDKGVELKTNSNKKNIKWKEIERNIDLLKMYLKCKKNSEQGALEALKIFEETSKGLLKLRSELNAVIAHC